jgi:hypothetical protein
MSRKLIDEDDGVGLLLTAFAGHDGPLLQVTLGSGAFAVLTSEQARRVATAIDQWLIGIGRPRGRFKTLGDVVASRLERAAEEIEAARRVIRDL